MGIRGVELSVVWMYKFCELFDESSCLVTPLHPHCTQDVVQARTCHNNKILCARMVGYHPFQSLALIGNLEAFVNHIPNADVRSDVLEPPTRCTHVAIVVYDKYSS